MKPPDRPLFETKHAYPIDTEGEKETRALYYAEAGASFAALVAISCLDHLSCFLKISAFGFLLCLCFGLLHTIGSYYMSAGWSFVGTRIFAGVTGIISHLGIWLGVTFTIYQIGIYHGLVWLICSGTGMLFLFPYVQIYRRKSGMAEAKLRSQQANKE